MTRYRDLIISGARTNQPDTWCFDASGNLLSKTASTCPPGYPTFVYDGEDQLTSVPSAGVSYLYDGSGTRVERCLPNCTSPTSWTVYIYSGRRDIAEYNNGAAVGSPSQEFIYSAAVPGSGLLASVTSGSTLTYFHSDHLGWRVSTNTSGQIVGQQGSYPYGENWYSQNGNEFMFASYQYDTQSALYYAMARWYDASAGRFCSADPVGGNPEDPQTWNRYPYSRNDPINITDPSGQSFWSWLAKIFEIVAIFAVAEEFAPVLLGLSESAQTIDTLTDVWEDATFGAGMSHVLASTQGNGTSQPSKSESPNGQGIPLPPAPLPPPVPNVPGSPDSYIDCGQYGFIITGVKPSQANQGGAGGYGHSPDIVAYNPPDFGLTDAEAGQLDRSIPSAAQSIIFVPDWSQARIPNRAGGYSTPTAQMPQIPNGLPNQGALEGADTYNPPSAMHLDIYYPNAKDAKAATREVPTRVYIAKGSGARCPAR